MRSLTNKEIVAVEQQIRSDQRHFLPRQEEHTHFSSLSHTYFPFFLSHSMYSMYVTYIFLQKFSFAKNTKNLV